MSAYIKLSTLEYPRHAGDIALDPVKDYELVEWVDPPEVAENQLAYELKPELKDGKWYMVWAIYTFTEQELEEQAQREKDRLDPTAKELETSTGTEPDVIG